MDILAVLFQVFINPTGDSLNNYELDIDLWNILSVLEMNGGLTLNKSSGRILLLKREIWTNLNLLVWDSWKFENISKVSLEGLIHLNLWKIVGLYARVDADACSVLSPYFLNSVTIWNYIMSFIVVREGYWSSRVLLSCITLSINELSAQIFSWIGI